jgi:transcriptional regulator with XRE-family HTH domain
MMSELSGGPRELARPGPRSNADISKVVRRLRRARGWTLEELAAISSVSRSMLSQIERGDANPSLPAAYRIARAFGAKLDELVEQGSGRQTAIEVMRASGDAYYLVNDGGRSVRVLSPLYLKRHLEFYEVTLGPGRSLISNPHGPGTFEFLVVYAGGVRVMSGVDSEMIEIGDSAYYPADVEHAIENHGDHRADLILVSVYSHATS